jgi:hypothetical protein
MQVIELILDEGEDATGVFAISIVEEPAIESNFIALSKADKVELAEVDTEKRLLMGAALIPNKMIYRRDGDDEFNVFFSKSTIRKVSELFFKNHAQSESTLEHEMKLQGLTVVESWIVEDTKRDKTAVHNLSVPVGSWMVSVKVDNDDIWQEFVKTGKVKGFSIEGYFADKTNLNKQDPNAQLIEDLKDVLKG